MFHRFRYMLAMMLLFVVVSITGVYATWHFAGASPQENSTKFDVVLNEFTFAPPETLYITDVQLISTSNASNVGVHFAHPTYLSTTINAARTNGSVTYRVTVYNNTPVTYWYLGPYWDGSVESNGLIATASGITLTTKDFTSDTSNTFNTNDWVPPYTSRDFYITYTFGSNALGNYRSTIIDLKFGLHMDAVQDEFLKILNDKVSANGYYYLADVFNQRYAEDGTTVIANLGEDKAIFDRLFGKDLTINVDGVDVPVTVMIQRENMDSRATGDQYSPNGPSGCEYTVYITVDPLHSPTGKAIVHAISYSCNGVGNINGQWYKLGQLYEGTASAQMYRDSGEVAFNVNSWIATAKEYEFVDGKAYKVGYEQGDQYDKLKTMKQIISANDQDVFNDIDNSQVLRKVYSIVHSSANYNKPGYEGLRTAFVAAAPFYNIYNNGQEVKVKRESTRAEIIPYMIAIQNALDYYNQVNP